MPHRAAVIARDVGRQVMYRNTSGEKRRAVLVAAGSSSGMKLRVESEQRIVDNVPAATSLKQTNVYFFRSAPA